MICMAEGIEPTTYSLGNCRSANSTGTCHPRRPQYFRGPRGLSLAAAPTAFECERQFHLTANTQIEPPCGTSGYLPGKMRFSRACIFAGSTPQPDWTAIYCLPSTANETGTAATPGPVGNSHRILPLLASKARNMRSLVPPANRTPPPVASTGPQLNDGSLVVHTFLPLSISQACSSPM